MSLVSLKKCALCAAFVVSSVVFVGCADEPKGKDKKGTSTATTTSSTTGSGASATTSATTTSGSTASTTK